MSATLDAAETYVARGWRVFLLAPGAGVPFKGSHGVNDATTDLDVIRAGLGEHPDANLAIATGAPGPQVFDADDLDAAQGVIAKLPASVPWAAIPGTNHPPGRH